MKKYTAGLLKTLADFLSNMALAWFVSGVIVPYFSPIHFIDKIFYAIIGIMFCYVFLVYSLKVSQFIN